MTKCVNLCLTLINIAEEIKRGGSEHARLAAEVKRLQTELDEARTQATLARLDLDEEKRKFQDEVASLQQLVTGKISY